MPFGLEMKSNLFLFFFMTLKMMYVIRQETNFDLDDETKLRLIHKTDFRAQ